MKKTKLLMPILGVTATLGAVVPAVVACGPKAEEEGNIEVEGTYQIADAYTDDKVTVSKLPNASIEKDYKVDIQWTHTTSGGESLPHGSQFNGLTVTEKTSGTPVDVRGVKWTDATQIAPNVYQTTLTVMKEALAALESIDSLEVEISVQRYNDYQYTCQVNRPVNDLWGYSTETGIGQWVYGCVSDGFACADSDYDFGFTINLVEMEQVLKKEYPNVPDLTLAGARYLEVYIYNGGGMPVIGADRVQASEWYIPTATIGDGESTPLEVTYEGDTYASLTIDLGHELTAEEVAEGAPAYVISGGFNVTLQFFRNMRGAKVCVFDRNRIND